MKRTFSAVHRQIANKIGLYIYIIVNPYMNIIPQINSYVAEKMERNIIHPWYHPARHMYWALVGTANKSFAGIYSSIEARWSTLPKIPLFPCLLPLLPCISQCLIYLDLHSEPFAYNPHHCPLHCSICTEPSHGIVSLYCPFSCVASYFNRTVLCPVLALLPQSCPSCCCK